jgi:hypothetical protein
VDHFDSDGNGMIDGAEFLHAFFRIGKEKQALMKQNNEREQARRLRQKEQFILKRVRKRRGEKSSSSSSSLLLSPSQRRLQQQQEEEEEEDRRPLSNNNFGMLLPEIYSPINMLDPSWSLSSPSVTSHALQSQQAYGSRGSSPSADIGLGRLLLATSQHIQSLH